MTEKSDRLIRLMRGCGPVLIAGVFAAMCVRTWGRWPDVFIDFGRELYIPWRIGEGDVLYRDLAYFNGTLSPYFNALVFKAFGVSVHALFFANLALLALFTTLAYRLLVGMGDRFSALVATLVFLAVFAFGQLMERGDNYNFVAPYSHEMTHGVMLGFAAIAALARWRECEKPWLLALGGLLVGLSLLTKPETAAAAIVAGAVSFACRAKQLSRCGRLAGSTVVFAFSMLVPLAVSVFLLTTAMPLGDALAATAKPWTSLISSDTTLLKYYQRWMGLDRPMANVIAMFAAAGAWCIALGPALVLALTVQRGARGARVWPFMIFVAYTIALIAMRKEIPWFSAARALPIFTLLCLGIAAAQLAKGSHGRRFVLALPFAALSLALLAKVVLNARVYHYGFALSLPATLLSITALASWLPNRLDARGAHGDIVRAAACATFLAFSIAHLEAASISLDNKRVAVASGSDSFLADLRGKFANRLLAGLEATPQLSTFLVLPEGVMLNFLARRKSSSKFLNFMPPEMLIFGEDAMLADLTAHPPEVIVLVHKDTSEYGFPFFGRDYGVNLMSWIRGNYTAAPPIGDTPLLPGAHFGAQVLVKNRP